jgi:predicted amidohydrolase
MQNQLNISLVQFDIKWEDMELNCSKIEGLIKANNFESDLIILPEMFNSGFSMHPRRIATADTNHRVCNWMKTLARKNSAVIVGSIAYFDDGLFYNRLLAVTPEGNVTHYNKRHLFRMSGEDEVYQRGNERVIIELGKWRVAVFVCYDLRFPVWSRNLNQYDMAIYVANWPHERRDAWLTLLNARAMENQCFVAGVNRVGKDPSQYYSGDTVLFDFKGQMLNKSPNDIEAVVNETIYLSELEVFRTAFPAWMDADDFEIRGE